MDLQQDSRAWKKGKDIEKLSKINSKSKFLNADGIRLFEVPEHVVCIIHCQSKTKRFE
jgi:hypothetical protein